MAKQHQFLIHNNQRRRTPLGHPPVEILAGTQYNLQSDRIVKVKLSSTSHLCELSGAWFRNGLLCCLFKEIMPPKYYLLQATRSSGTKRSYASSWALHEHIAAD